MNTPRAILFDLGDTVLLEQRFDIAAGARRLLEIARNPRGLSLDQVAAAVERLRSDFEARRRTSLVEIPAEAFQRLLYEPLGIEFDRPHDQVAQEFWTAAQTMSPAPGVEAILEELARRQIPLAIISNSVFAGRILEGELERHRLRRHFRFVMSSADYGVRKPHPALFLAAVGKLDLSPRRMWFIGDSLECDVGGARSAGMSAIWYNPGSRPAPPSAPLPDAQVRSMMELLVLLGSQPRPSAT